MINPALLEEYRRQRGAWPSPAQYALERAKALLTERAQERLLGQDRWGTINTMTMQYNRPLQNGVIAYWRISIAEGYTTQDFIEITRYSGYPPAQTRSGEHGSGSGYLFKLANGHDEESIYQCHLDDKVGKALARRRAFESRRSLLVWLFKCMRGDAFEVDVKFWTSMADDEDVTQTFDSDDTDGIRRFIYHALDSTLDLIKAAA